MSYCPYCNAFTEPSHCQVPRCGGFICGTCDRCNRQERFHPSVSQQNSENKRAGTIPRVVGTVTALAVMAMVAAGCADGHAATSAHKPAPRYVYLSTLQACRRLRSDIVANGGKPDKPTLDYITLHAADSQIASLARFAAQDVGDTTLIFSPSLARLHYLCNQQGVAIPVYQNPVP